MDNLEQLRDRIFICSDDIPVVALEDSRKVGLVALDIETTGLNWKEDKIGTCQVYIPNSGIYIVKLNNTPPQHLTILLNDPKTCKVFHHAAFDLRFMTYRWSIEAQNIACTKIASKILNISLDKHTLKNIVQKHLGVSLNKEQQTSNWVTTKLTGDQIEYAANDVIYLPDLFKTLHYKLVSCGRWPLAKESFAYLPIRVQLDILGAGDVFLY